MPQEITDANDCVVKVGDSNAGTADGALIIDDFEVSVTKNLERKYGVGNRDAEGRTTGNREIDLSFTDMGEHSGLIEEIDEGDFTVKLSGNEKTWECDHVDGDYTVSISDGGDYTFEFDGHALTFQLDDA